jgi:hypothetical protein
MRVRLSGVFNVHQSLPPLRQGAAIAGGAAGPRPSSGYTGTQPAGGGSQRKNEPNLPVQSPPTVDSTSRPGIVGTAPWLRHVEHRLHGRLAGCA